MRFNYRLDDNLVSWDGHLFDSLSVGSLCGLNDRLFVNDLSGRSNILRNRLNSFSNNRWSIDDSLVHWLYDLFSNDSGFGDYTLS